MKALRSFLFIGTLLAATAAWGQIRVLIDGEPVPFADQEPLLINNHVMIPIRDVFENFGLEVIWVPATQEIVAFADDITIALAVNDPIATVDDEDVEMDQAPTMVNGRVLIPLQFIEDLGAEVAWDAEALLVTIDTQAPSEGGEEALESARIPLGTVFQVKLDTPLDSQTAQPGDPFQATLETNNKADYAGLPTGTVFEGHVAGAKAVSDSAPGLLSLAFDRIVLPDGTAVPISASMVRLDDPGMTTTQDGVLLDENPSTIDPLLLGYGDWIGVLVSNPSHTIPTSDVLIASTLGDVLEGGDVDSEQFHDVILEKDTAFGIRLEKDLTPLEAPADQPVPNTQVPEEQPGQSEPLP